MPVMSLEQILIDPEFQKLSQAEQQAIIKSMSGSVPPPAEQPVGSALTKTEGISELPTFQREIDVGKLGVLVPGAKYEEGTFKLPSLETLTDTLPIIGGALGAVLGGPGGASLGSMGGEGWRQVIRRSVGAPQATGVVSSALGQDPNSTDAALTSLATEGFGGGLTEALGGSTAAKAMASDLERAAPMTYAKLFGPKSQREHRILANRITPVFDELPINNPFSHRSGRDALEDLAAEKAKTAGEQVSKVYRTDQESSFLPTRDYLKKKAAAEVRTEGDWVYTQLPDGTYLKDWVPADIKNKPLHSAFRERAQTMNKAQSTRDLLEKPVTLEDILDARQTADDLARAEKSLAPSRKASENSPPVRALTAERSALAKTLHDATGGPQGAGATADKIFSAWKTVEKGATAQDPSNFIVRWFTGRAVPGKTGTGLGALTTRTAFWSSLHAKTQMALARALKAGDKEGFAQILRGAMDVASQPEPANPEVQ